MDSKTDTPIILTEAHANKTVQGLLNFLIKELDLKKKASVATSSITTSKTTGEFKVRVIVDSLNIRAGAGTNYSVKGAITDKGTYTIVETSGDWGRLKSGAGWVNINSKYAKKI